MTESNSQNEKTIGERRVRIDFNVCRDEETWNDVDQCKRAFAMLINQCDHEKHRDPRLAAEAMTRIEDAAHWMVKLLTATS